MPLAIKDLVRLKLAETLERRTAFEQRYGMDFAAFKQAWDEGRIAGRYSYQLEQDYREWEVTATDEERLRDVADTLL